MKIEVQSSKAEKKEGKIKQGARIGEDYRMVSQEMWLHNGKAYPERVVLPLSDEQYRQLPDGSVEGFAPGFYTFAPESFEAGEFDRLQFARRIVLEPVKAAAVEPIKQQARA